MMLNKTLMARWLAVGVVSAVMGVASMSAAAEQKEIKLAYVEWDSCVAATSVAQALLEDAGYKVETLSVTGALMYQGLANNDADASLCAWLPATHEDYYAKTKDRLDNLGPNMDAADLGLAVPDYVDVKTIPELKERAGEFKDRIIGIDPGAGLMRLTQDVIDTYELPMTLVEGSDATMAGALKSAIDQEEPIVVTSWKPHWMWAQWDLHYLEDPENVYGDPDEIDTITRKGLKDDAPEAYAILDKIKMGSAERGELMIAARENDNAEPIELAREWVKNNQDLISEWTAD